MNNTNMILRGLVITAAGFTLLCIRNMNNIFYMIGLGSLVIGISVATIIKQFK